MAWGNPFMCATLAIIAGGLATLHVSEWEWHDPGVACWLAAGAVLFAWLGFTAWLGWQRRRKARRLLTPMGDAVGEGDPLWVAYASQTGNAEQLARQTLQSLQQAGMDARLIDLGELDADALAHRCQRCGRVR